MTGDTTGRPVGRRAVLAALAGSGGCTSLAGETSTGTPTETSTGTPTETPTPTPSPTPEPPGLDGNWRQYRRGTANAGYAPGDRGPVDDVEAVWAFEAEEILTAQPVVADGVAYVSGRQASTYAVDVRTGESLWNHHARSDVGMALHEGTLYLGTVPGKVVALDAADGTQRWETEIGDLFASAPAVAGDTVVAACRGTLAALDAGTGRVRWRFELGGEGEPSPAVVDGVVYVGDKDGGVYALDLADGSQRWRASPGGAVHAGPAVRGETVYVSKYVGVVALDAATGEERWTATPSGFLLTPPTVTDEVVLAGQGTKVAFDAATGERAWRYDAIEWRSSRGTPSTAAGDTVYVAGPDGNVHALALASGEPRWVYDVDGDPAAAPVAVDDLLLVTDHAWQLVALAEGADGG